jgi:hypothetical protein
VLVWSLSPVGTLLNGGLLCFVLIAAGASWKRPMLWLIVAIFLAACTYFDVRAYVARRRHGLTAYEVGELVMDRMWGPARPEEER